MTRRGPLLLSLGAVAIAAALAVTGTSCGGDPACGEHSHDPTCAACTGDEDVAAAGTTVAGDDGVFSIELVTASEQFTPGSQSIVIRVVDGDGAPVDGVSFDHIEVTGNVSRGNDMGYAFMFSRGLTVTDNLSDGDRTHGIFMNFANKATIRHNDVRNGGDKCLFIYNSNGNRFEANRFEGCGIGVHFTAGSEGNAMTGNAFVNNRIQVKYVGTRWLEWSVDGRGNYWSDHGGFDVNGDGLADSHYRPNDLVDRITWSQPMARLLLGSPAVQLIRWSQSRFPGLLPGGVIDSHPLMSPDGAGLTPAAEPREGGPS